MKTINMDKYELQKLRELPIEGVAERLGLTVNRHRCLCCFHDDHTPSMSFDVRKNTFRCWACGAHGGVIDLTLKLLSLEKSRGNSPFLEACNWLANENNVLMTKRKITANEDTVARIPFNAARYTKYFEHPWLSAGACKFLYEERHLNPVVVKYCRLNSYGDWLQIPYYNTQGRLIGVQRRYMGKDPNQPRFRFARGEECHLYNQQVIPMLRPGEPLYLGEGPSDVWALLSSGKKAVGIPSATLLKPSDLKLLSPLSPNRTKQLPPNSSTDLHIYPDKDEAGEALYRKLLNAANDLGLCLVRHDLPEGCKDFSDYWVKQKIGLTKN